MTRSLFRIGANLSLAALLGGCVAYPSGYGYASSGYHYYASGYPYYGLGYPGFVGGGLFFGDYGHGGFGHGGFGHG